VAKLSPSPDLVGKEPWQRGADLYRLKRAVESNGHEASSQDLIWAWSLACARFNSYWITPIAFDLPRVYEMLSQSLVVAADEERAVDWRTRLIIDPEVSDTSPIVRGTWVTVAHMVNMIVDGWSWADILRNHPELTEDDIRACLAYTIEGEKPTPTRDSAGGPRGS
jgi:uncharacterized protein (DUF433 family)